MKAPLEKAPRRLLPGLLLLLAGCGGNTMIYQQAELDSFLQQQQGRALSFQTRAGNQTAFYVPPKADPSAAQSSGADPSPAGPSAPSAPLVICYPGISSRALDWLWLPERSPEPRAGFLLIEYPGRGLCKGRMRPKYLPESSDGALAALAAQLGVERAALEKDTRFIGHSFGTAAALQFACRLETPPRAIVLVAPLTTLHKALFRKFGPLAWLNPDRMDNRAYLTQLHGAPEPPAVAIFHGDADNALPVKMGRQLTALFPEWIRYREIPGVDHVGILRMCGDEIIQALFPERPKETEKTTENTEATGKK